MDWKPAPRFYAAAQFAKPMPKRVGMPDSEYLPETVDEFHAVKPTTWLGQQKELTKINIDDRVRSTCGTYVEVQYPIEFNPDEEGACKACARNVRKAKGEPVNRPPIQYRTETPE